MSFYSIDDDHENMTYLIVTSYRTKSQRHHKKCARLNPLLHLICRRVCFCAIHFLSNFPAHARSTRCTSPIHYCRSIHTGFQFNLLYALIEKFKCTYNVHNFWHFSPWTAIIWQEVQGSCGVFVSCEKLGVPCFVSLPHLRSFVPPPPPLPKTISVLKSGAGFGLQIQFYLTSVLHPKST